MKPGHSWPYRHVSTAASKVDEWQSCKRQNSAKHNLRSIESRAETRSANGSSNNDGRRNADGSRNETA